MAEAIASVARDYGHAESIGRAGRELANTTFNPRRAAGVLVELVADCRAISAASGATHIRSDGTTSGPARGWRCLTRSSCSTLLVSAGSGGPITALGRILESRLSQRYTFVRLHQTDAIGAIDYRRITDWARMLRSVKPDLVHVRGLGNEGFHAALAAQIARCPRILVSIHGTVRDLNAPGARGRRLVLTHVLEPLTLRMATHVATVCLYAAERGFVRRHRSKLVGVVPNGVPVNPLNRRLREQVRSALGYRNDEVVGIVVGRLSLEKGHRVLARALQQNPRTVAGLRLLVVGDGPDREAIRRLYDDVPELQVNIWAFGTMLTTSCRRQTFFSSRVFTKTSPTHSSRLWPPDCRSWPHLSVAMSKFSAKAGECWCHRPTRSR